MLLTDNKSVSKVGYSTAGGICASDGLRVFLSAGERERGGRVATVVWGVVVVLGAVVLALILYTIRALEYPFDGIVQVKPVAFEEFLDKIEGGGR